MRYFHNQNTQPLPKQRALVHECFPDREFTAAWDHVTAWPAYEATPLRRFRGAESQLNVACVHFKDESVRLGLKSFKSLGGSYAAFVLAQRWLVAHGIPANAIDVSALQSGALGNELTGFTLSCATDGNHGRALAWAAQKMHCRCVIFLHENVSRAREDALRRLGASVIRVKGTYDDSVEIAASMAANNGWSLVSDTSGDGAADSAFLVMNGYRVLAEECLRQGLLSAPPTHLFVQAGVGGLAAALVAHFTVALEDPPAFVIVEPISADCLLQSAAAGKPIRIDGDLQTIMAGLSCGEPSHAIWPILQACVSHFVALEDGLAIDAVRDLAFEREGMPLESGESGAVGYAALRATAGDVRLRGALGLSAESRVLLVGTEGATDPDVYQKILSGGLNVGSHENISTAD